MLLFLSDERAFCAKSQDQEHHFRHLPAGQHQDSRKVSHLFYPSAFVFHPLSVLWIWPDLYLVGSGNFMLGQIRI